MYLKSLSFVFALAISLLTPNAFAQDRTGPSSKTSIRRLCLTDPSSFLKPKKAMPPATCTRNLHLLIIAAARYSLTITARRLRKTIRR